MDVRVGDIWAKCSECGGVEFNPLDEPQPDGNQKVRCRICGTPTTRAELLVQTGDEASRHAADGDRLKNKGPGA
jgi:hypothetical protein